MPAKSPLPKQQQQPFKRNLPHRLFWKWAQASLRSVGAPPVCVSLLLASNGHGVSKSEPVSHRSRRPCLPLSRCRKQPWGGPSSGTAQMSAAMCWEALSDIVASENQADHLRTARGTVRVPGSAGASGTKPRALAGRMVESNILIHCDSERARIAQRAKSLTFEPRMNTNQTGNENLRRSRSSFVKIRAPLG